MDPNELIILNKEEYVREVPLVSEFNQICRLCMLLITETESLKSIHDEHFNMSIKSLLEIYTLLKIPDKDDRLPPNICLDCANFLIEMHTFRSRCQVSNDILLKISKQLEKAQENIDTTEQIPSQLLPFENISMQLCDVKLGCFQCKDCNVVLDDKTFFAHSCKITKPRVKSNGGQILCTVCSKLVCSRRLSQHMLSHSTNKHKCKECSYSTRYIHNLQRHMLQHTGIKPYLCIVCDKGFTQKADLRKHEKRHTDESGEGCRKGRPGTKQRQVCICQYCRYGFVSQSLLEEHVAVAHNNGKLTTATVREKSKTIYKCQHTGCKEMFEYEYELIKHAGTHVNAMPFTCSVCNRTFKFRGNLLSDLSGHIGEKVYSCKYCPKRFVKNISLRVHERIHSGTKKYVCDTCGKAYVQKQQLKVHKLTHTGEKPFICEFCGQAFALGGNLRVHKRIHTGETPYKCCVCDKGFRNSSGKNRHQREVHTEHELQTALACIN